MSGFPGRLLRPTSLWELVGVWIPELVGVWIPGIYSALLVSEVWRFRDNIMSIEQLDSNGNYVNAPSSRFLHVRADEIDRWLSEGKSGDRNRWRRRLQKWVKAVLKPRVGSARLEAQLNEVNRHLLDTGIPGCLDS